MFTFWFIQASQFKTKKLGAEEQSGLFPSSIILNVKMMWEKKSVTISFLYMVTRRNWFTLKNIVQTFCGSIKDYWNGADQKDYISLVFSFSKLSMDDYEVLWMKKYIGSFSLLLIYPSSFAFRYSSHPLIWRLQSRVLSLKGKNGYILKFAVTVNHWVL